MPVKVRKWTKKMSQLMRLRHLSHRRPVKVQASLRICAVSPEPSLFAHMKYESRGRVRPKKQASSPTGWLRMHGWRKSLRSGKKYHNLMSWFNYTSASLWHGSLQHEFGYSSPGLDPKWVSETPFLDYTFNSSYNSLHSYFKLGFGLGLQK